MSQQPLKDVVTEMGAAYGIAYGEDEDGNPTEVFLYARFDAAEALTPVLQEFEKIWEATELEEDKTLRFTLTAEQA